MTCLCSIAGVIIVNFVAKRPSSLFKHIVNNLLNFEDMKIAKKHETKVTLSIMVFVMTNVVTFVSVGVNFGFEAGFVEKWMKMWLLSFSVAIPVVLTIMPVVKRNVARLIQD